MAVIQEPWIGGGVSTRKVDDLVPAMGLGGISKSTVSKLCKDIDERVGEFLNRPLIDDWRAPWSLGPMAQHGAPVARRDIFESARGAGASCR